MESKKIWKAALSARLSKEDGDREESDSISNQKDLIKQFVKSHSDIQIVDEYVDDGYTGVNFDRPNFQRMLNDIKAGKIDCVIVKDLSRFGRNWTESGKYIDKIFPFLGVRFIAINDNVDTANERTSSDNLIIPFKNLINEAYPRQTSISTRSHLETKRINGEFIGNFCVFGYKKDTENHNKLIIDEGAADVIRDIFKWKIQGFSQQAISDRLNENGIPSPLEYKRRNAENLKTPFQVKRKTDWTAVAVGRILKNEIYTGVLEQGKNTTPNFKVKKRIANIRKAHMR